MGWERGERKSECSMILLCEDAWKGSFATCLLAGSLLLEEVKGRMMGTRVVDDGMFGPQGENCLCFLYVITYEVEWADGSCAYLVTI